MYSLKRSIPSIFSFFLSLSPSIFMKMMMITRFYFSFPRFSFGCEKCMHKCAICLSVIFVVASKYVCIQNKYIYQSSYQRLVVFFPCNLFTTTTTTSKTNHRYSCEREFVVNDGDCSLISMAVFS